MGIGALGGWCPCGGTNVCGPWKKGGLGAGKCPGGVKFPGGTLGDADFGRRGQALLVVLGSPTVSR